MPFVRQALRRGFTMIELIVVIAVIGTLAVVALPRMGSALALADHGWREQVMQGLLQARSLAIGHRRIVCFDFDSSGVQLRMASTPGATACDVALPGQDGGARWASNARGDAGTMTPAQTLYFQPDGRITQDAAGLTPQSATITIADDPAIAIAGSTGFIQ